MKNRLFKTSVLVPVFIFFILSMTIVYVWKYFEHQKTQDIKLKTELVTEQIATHFEEYLKAHIEIVKHIRREWFEQNISTPLDFEKIILPLMKSFPGFQAINYIDPKGIIRWVYPEETNIKAKDRDLHDHPFAAETFSIAENTGADYVTPVIELWQGGLGIATYFPLIRDGKLEGYINGVFRVNDFIRYYFKKGIDRKFCLHLKEDGREFDLLGDEIMDHDHHIASDYPVSILNQKWIISLSPRPELIHATSSYIKRFFLVLSILLSGVFSLVVRQLILRRQKLYDSEILFRKLFNSSKDAIMTLNPPGWKFTSGNKTLMTMFNVKDEKELVTLGPWDISPDFQPDGQPSDKKAREMIKIAMESGSNYFEWAHKRLDGSTFPATVLLTRVDLESGPFLQATVRDITDQKREEQLQSVLYGISQAVSTTTNLEELYRAIHNQLTKVIDTTNFFISLIDEDKNVMTYPYFVDEYDDPPKPRELTNKTISEYVIQTGLPLYLKENDIKDLEDKGLIGQNDFGTISKVWLGSPLQLKNKSIGVIVVQSYHDPGLYSEEDLDILNFVSEQIATAIARKQIDEFTRESEKKYRLLSEQLSEANTLKEILLDIITHDLKNPIGVISTLTEMMLEEEPGNDDYMGLIKSSSDALLQVIDNATTLAQVAVGDKIKLEEINITKVIHSVGKEFSTQLQDSKMTLKIELPGNLKIMANPIISEVFSNYISNAIKYASEGKMILIDSSNEDEDLVINVKDFGPEIPESKYRDIFYRGIQIAGEKKHGRGLGLAIVKRIAEVHYAEVGVKPNQPKGNIFYIKIPMFSIVK